MGLALGGQVPWAFGWNCSQERKEERGQHKREKTRKSFFCWSSFRAFPLMIVGFGGRALDWGGFNRGQQGEIWQLEPKDLLHICAIVNKHFWSTINTFSVLLQCLQAKVNQVLPIVLTWLEVKQWTVLKKQWLSKETPRKLNLLSAPLTEGNWLTVTQT